MSSPQYRARISKDEPLVHLSRKGSRKALRIHICRSPTPPTTLIPIARGICFSRNSNWILVEYVRGTFYIVARAGPIFIDLKPPIKLILLLIPLYIFGRCNLFFHSQYLIEGEHVALNLRLCSFKPTSPEDGRFRPRNHKQPENKEERRPQLSL